MQRPGALAVAPDGSLVVADGDRIVRRAVDGTFSVIAQIGATSLFVTPDGAIFAAEPDESRVLAVGSNGAVSIFAALPHPASLAGTPDGTVYVVEDDGVVAVAPDGSTRLVVGHRFVEVHGTPMAFFPSTVTVGLDGNLYVADLGVKAFAEFAPDGALLDAWGPQVYVSPGTGLAAAPDGSIVLAEWGGRIERLHDGVLSTIIDGYRANGVAVAADGTVYFVDGNNGWSAFAGLWSIAPNGALTRLEPR